MARDRVTRENATKNLLEVVPEIRAEYESWITNPDEPPGLYVVLGCCLIPYLLPLLEGDVNNHEEPLQRIFSFIERMMISGDEYLEDAAAISIGENLLFSTNEAQRTKALRYSGSATTRMYNDLVDWWAKHGDNLRARQQCDIERGA